MADNFHTLDEAAKLLNVTPEQLGEMRDNGEIRGFRDGSTWKFKTTGFKIDEFRQRFVKQLEIWSRRAHRFQTGRTS